MGEKDSMEPIFLASSTIEEHILEATFVAGPDVQAKIEQIVRANGDLYNALIDDRMFLVRGAEYASTWYETFHSVAGEFRVAAIAEIT